MENFITGDKKQLLAYLVYSQAFFVLPFTICSFVVAGTANAGFNAILTTLINIGFLCESFYIIHHSKTSIAIGFLIGSSIMITTINFMTSIYWGQLSKCKSMDISVAQYTCSNPDAYGALSAFAVFLFLIQFLFSGLIIYWRRELIQDDSGPPSSHDPSSFDRDYLKVPIYKPVQIVEL